MSWFDKIPWETVGGYAIAALGSLLLWLKKRAKYLKEHKRATLDSKRPTVPVPPKHSWWDF